jgi:hypothetical protein
MTGNLTRSREPVAARWLHNTAELSGELSKGDVVVVGEVPLAVASAGWTLVGGLTEVRTSEHGTRPLPERSRLPGEGDSASSCAEGAS